MPTVEQGTAPTAAPGRRTRLTAAERELQLLDIAERLFAEHGYEGVTIGDIARAAGISRPIIYQHHGSKDGIFLACVRRARAQFEQTFADRTVAAFAAGGGLHEVIDAGGAAFFSLVESSPRRWALLFTSSASLGGNLAEQLMDLRFTTVSRICEAARALAPEASEETLTVAAHAISGVAEQLGRWWLRNPDVPAERVRAHFTAAAVGIARSLLEADTPAHAAARPAKERRA